VNGDSSSRYGSFLIFGAGAVFIAATWLAAWLLPSNGSPGYNPWDVAIGLATTLVTTGVAVLLHRGAGSGEAGAPTRTRVAGASVTALVAVAGLVAVAVHVRRPAGATPVAAASPSEDPSPIRAAVRWCCKLVDAELENYTRYWPGTRESLLAGWNGQGEWPAQVVRTGGTWLEVAVQSTTDAAVLLQGVRVRVHQRRPTPVSGFLVTVPCECGAGGDVRTYRTSLDAVTPAVRPYGDTRGKAYYYVRRDEPEVLAILVDDQECDCDFDLELEWLVAGREGRTVLDDGGRPFRMIGEKGLPHYVIQQPGSRVSLKEIDSRSGS